MNTVNPKNDRNELEARIVAMVCGEASDFERDELMRLIDASPELAEFRRQIQEADKQLREIAADEFPGDLSADRESDWQLSEDRREFLLATFDGKLPPEKVRAPVDLSKLSPLGRFRHSPWFHVSWAASLLCVLGASGLWINMESDSRGLALMMDTSDAYESDFAAEGEASPADSPMNASQPPTAWFGRARESDESREQVFGVNATTGRSSTFDSSGSTVQGQTLPSPYYLQDDVQYFPAETTPQSESPRFEASQPQSGQTDKSMASELSISGGTALHYSVPEPQLEVPQLSRPKVGGTRLYRESAPPAAPELTVPETPESAPAKPQSAVSSSRSRRRKSELAERDMGMDMDMDMEMGMDMDMMMDFEMDVSDADVSSRSVADGGWALNFSKSESKAVKRKSKSEGFADSGDGAAVGRELFEQKGKPDAVKLHGLFGAAEVQLGDQVSRLSADDMMGEGVDVSNFSSGVAGQGSGGMGGGGYGGRAFEGRSDRGRVSGRSATTNGVARGTEALGLQEREFHWSESQAQGIANAKQSAAKTDRVDQNMDGLSNQFFDRWGSTADGYGVVPSFGKNPVASGLVKGLEAEAAQSEFESLDVFFGDVATFGFNDQRLRDSSLNADIVKWDDSTNTSGKERMLRRSAGQPAKSLDETLAADEAFSTFSLHVSDVSFKLAQDALAKSQWPDPKKIRIEECVNAMDYGDPLPRGDEKVACQIEQAAHPFMQQRNVMRIAMKTAAAGRASETPLRLTFLLDNSGSMERPDRQAAVRNAFRSLTEQLKPEDQVTLLSFSRQPRLLADRVSGAEAQRLVDTVTDLPSEGGTNIEAAFSVACEKAIEQQAPEAQNRIVLLTDGAVNLGDADPQRLMKKVIEMRDAGIATDAAGIGADGLNDEVLEALTRNGDGRYYMLATPESADDDLASQIAGALRPSAKNVKVQVEFNPKRVTSYKLLGYEKHRLNKEDFRNDAVDAAEMAAAESGVAVYQFEARPDGEGDVGSVSVRFRDLSSDQMVEHRWPIPYQSDAPAWEQSDPALRIASSAAMFAAKLRGDAIGGVVDLKKLSEGIAKLPAEQRSKKRVAELDQMITQARNLQGSP